MPLGMCFIASPSRSIPLEIKEVLEHLGNLILGAIPAESLNGVPGGMQFHGLPYSRVRKLGTAPGRCANELLLCQVLSTAKYESR